MSNYRLYRLQDDHIVEAWQLAARDDDHALEQARTIAPDAWRELWQRARKVAVIEPYRERAWG